MTQLQLGAFVVTSIALPTHLYWHDVARNIEVQQDARMGIEVIDFAEKEENNRIAIISIHGFGNYDATDVAKNLGIAMREIIDGQLWSVVYGNAFHDPASVADIIMQSVREHGIEEVVLLGYSAGGDLAAQAARDLIQQRVKVSLVAMVSTANGIDGLRPTQVEEIEVARIVQNIAGATHSSAVRFLGEMYFRRDRYEYDNPLQFLGDAFTTADAVLRDLDNEKLPSTELLINQVNIIAESDIPETIQETRMIGDHIYSPVYVYFGTAPPGRDYVVLDDKSGNEICTAAYQTGFMCFKADVPGAIHTRPDLKTEEYMQTAQFIAPTVRAALAKAVEDYRMGNLSGRLNQFQ